MKNETQEQQNESLEEPLETRIKRETDETLKRLNREMTKSVGICLLGLGLCYSASWGLNAHITRETHPIRQGHKLEEYHEKKNKIFKPYGLADRNQDGVIDFPERVDAYRRMGFTQEFHHWQWPTTYPSYNLRHLDKAIESYKLDEPKTLNSP